MSMGQTAIIKSTMDGEMRRGAAAKFVEWRVKKAKLALAVAIIKSRPAGESGRQYAEALAVNLRNQDEAWRSKVHGLEENVLRLRQELLLTKMQLKPKHTTSQAGDGFMDVFNQDLLGSDKERLSSDMDSGCGLEIELETWLPTRNSAETSAQPALPPASSGPQFSFSTLSEGGPHQETPMLLHMRFLQSLCGLRWLEGEWGLEAAELSTMDRDRSVVAESLFQLLSCVATAFGDARRVAPPPMLLQAARVAAQTVEHWTSHRKPSVQFVTNAEDALKELTGVLLQNNQLNRFQIQDKLSECLILLSESSLLKSLLIRHVLSEINRLADRFCQGDNEGPAQFEVALYENSFYLFWVVEQLLQGPQGPGRTGGIDHHWALEQKALLGRLESSVLLLCDEFPLFALYLWGIGALLTPSDTTKT